MTETVIISLGGSTLFSNHELNAVFLKSFSDIIFRSMKKVKLGIVVGGGSTAKSYVQAVKELGGKDFDADRLGIECTKLNALLLISLLKENAYSKVPRDLDTGMQALQEGVIPVFGGLLEGLTTDTVSVLLAERTRASRVINVSNVDALYDYDPKDNTNAKKYSKLTHDELVSICSDFDERKARTNFVFDVIASKIAQRSQVAVHFVGTNNLSDLENAINGLPHTGTVVS